MNKTYLKLVDKIRGTLDLRVDATDCKGKNAFDFGGVDRCRYAMHARIPQCSYFRYNTYNPALSQCRYQREKENK